MTDAMIFVGLMVAVVLTYDGAVCVTAGTPVTWKTFGASAA